MLQPLFVGISYHIPESSCVVPSSSAVRLFSHIENKGGLALLVRLMPKARRLISFECFHKIYASGSI